MVRPGWSTSWIAAANNAAIVSRGVKTDWKVIISFGFVAELQLIYNSRPLRNPNPDQESPKTEDVRIQVWHLTYYPLRNSDLESGAVQEDVGRVEDVGGVDAVVVGDVADVVVAQGDEEREQHLLRDLEGVAEVAVLEERNTALEQRTVPCSIADSGTSSGR